MPLIWPFVFVKVQTLCANTNVYSSEQNNFTYILGVFSIFILGVCELIGLSFIEFLLHS